MNIRRVVLAGLASLIIASSLTASSLTAGEPVRYSPFTWSWPNCVGKFCPDDFCPKPLPCARGVKCFQCPDYCAKPLPCFLPGKTSYVCDDYCRKSLPPTCCASGKGLTCTQNCEAKSKSRLVEKGNSVPSRMAASNGEPKTKTRTVSRRAAKSEKSETPKQATSLRLIRLTK